MKTVRTRRNLVLILIAVLLFAVTNRGVALDEPPDSLACTGVVTTSLSTPLGALRIYNQNRSERNIACLDGTVLVIADDTGDFGTMCLSCFDYIRENGRIQRKDGGILVRRGVIFEERRARNDNQYWLLDFRGRAPLVVGPFGAHEAGEHPTVIWNDRSVIVVLDNQEVQWPDGPRYIERNAKGEGSYEVDDEGTPIPHINRDGKLLGKDGKPRTYPLGVCYIAFVYDYDQKKLYKAYIDE